MTTSPTIADGGVFVVSVRRVEDPQALRAAAYEHVGLAAGATLPAAFTSTGFDAEDLTRLLDGLTTLRTDPETLPRNPTAAFGGKPGVDSEGRATDVYMLGMSADSGQDNWLACAEAAHEVWPRLLDTIGATVGGLACGPGPEETRSISLPGIRVPKALRLKTGWDYDADGNQVWLPIEEAWRRLTEHLESQDDEVRRDAPNLRRIRRDMEGFYRERAKQARRG